MTRVISFDSFDDALRKMQEAEERANASTIPAQRAITYGDYWCYPNSMYDVVIFGRVWTEGEAYEGEDLDTIRTLKNSHERGYRFGIAYSVIEPDGEIGSTHIANMIPISKELFDEAKRLEWKCTAELLSKLRDAAEKARTAR